jgi:hypothetical protein
MMHRYRRTAAALLAAASITLLAACGSSSSSNSGSGASGARPAGFKLTASEQSCLKQHGVTLGGRPGFGKRPGGATGGPPSGGGQGGPPSGGKPPAGAFGRKGAHGGFPHAGAAQTKAFKACGVSLPSGVPRGGAPTAG